MTYTSALELNGLAPDPSLASQAASPIAPSTGPETVGRTSSSQNSAVVEIASDSAKVSLAGTMLSQASLGSDVRFDKVAALRQSIEAGTYTIPTAAIADQLISSLQ